MTRVSGHSLIVSPCCRSIYKTVVYASLNMSAIGYWTDGAQEHGLSPTDGGLRICRCGAGFLLKDAVRLDIEAGPEIEFAERPKDDQLPAIIESASSPCLEVTARRNYWRFLNDEYRARYRAHRETEDAIADAQWKSDYYASLPLLARSIRRLLRSEPTYDFPKATRPFTVPPFHPSAEQVENMSKLLALVLAGGDAPFRTNGLELAELHRQLGQFEAAAQALREYQDDYREVLKKMIGDQVAQRCNAPVRFRL